MTFYKWVYRDKNGNLVVSVIFYNEDGISPYGCNLNNLGTPVQTLESQKVFLKDWKIRDGN